MCYLYFILHRFVYIWDTVFQRLIYKLPGHLGSVNDVDFHPKEPISKWREGRREGVREGGRERKERGGKEGACHQVGGRTTLYLSNREVPGVLGYRSCLGRFLPVLAMLTLHPVLGLGVDCCTRL